MSPRSRRTVWQDDCSFWPEQNFFHRITWDWTSKMVLMCWFWIIPPSPLYLSLVGVGVGAHTCSLAPEFIASKDSGKGSNHPLSSRILSTGIQGNDLPPLPVLCQSQAQENCLLQGLSRHCSPETAGLSDKCPLRIASWVMWWYWAFLA